MIYLTVKAARGSDLNRTNCQWDMGHGLQLAGITLFWLAGLNTGWDCLSSNGMWFHLTGGNFHRFRGALTVSLHSPNDRQLASHWGCARRLWKVVNALFHNIDVIMGAMTSQFTGVSIVFPVVCSGADQRKHQRSASLAFVWGIQRWRLVSRHKGPVMRKMFPFNDIIMKQGRNERLH